jgi:intracellular multiplication protein IcmP
MAAASSGQDQGAEKNAYFILWLIALVAIVGAVIWYFLGYQLKQFFIFVKIYELTAIRFCLELFSDTVPWVANWAQNGLGEVTADLNAARQLTPENLTLEMTEILSGATGIYLRYPIAIYLALLTLAVFKTNVQMRLRKKYNMHTLALQEQENWPQIKIATKVDLLNEDLESGPWAMAMTPMQFAKAMKLITVNLAPSLENPFSKSKGSEYKVTLNKVRAERAFSIQLGRGWQGVERMTPHRRAVFAVFAARGSRDTKTALALISQLARSAAEGTLDCQGADALWKKHIKNKPVQEICARHAYEFTVFISMLQFAREDGVMASADFLWVKPLDRRLWYVINNVGRQTPAAEVGGIFSHWYYEMALKRPLSAPRVDSAVDALEVALTEVMYVPDDKEKEEILKRHEEIVEMAK